MTPAAISNAAIAGDENRLGDVTAGRPTSGVRARRFFAAEEEEEEEAAAIETAELSPGGGVGGNTCGGTSTDECVSTCVWNLCLFNFLKKL